MNMTRRLYVITARLLLEASLLLLTVPVHAQNWSTVTTTDNSAPDARHESAATVVDGKIYLIGGRGERDVNVYDPVTNTWQTVAEAPLELHHFQPVAYKGKIYVIGAFTCCFPSEPTIPDIYVFDPATNSWSIVGSMPEDRLRGSTGTVLHQDKIYIIGGNTMGHDGGAVNWFDEYDPETGAWRVLPDAPNARDHFAAAIADGKLVIAGGRQSQRSFANTVAATDVYDFSSGTWDSTSHNIPTQRAGTMAEVFENKVYVLGGESGLQESAHTEVQVFNPANGLWSQISPMINPRHAGGSALIGSELHVFVGSDLRGASGEFDGHEKIDLSQATLTPLAGTPPLLITQDSDADGVADYAEINVHGTDPSKTDTDNDGINDFDELFATNTDANNPDSDGDGVPDNTELELNLDPNNPDTDADRINDGDELNVHNTSPINDDSDNDGIKDGDEVLVYGSIPNDIDSDNDNLPDGFEIHTLESNPTAADTDGDGLRDDLELNIYRTSVTVADTDFDGVNDGQEINTHSSDPLTADTDGDGVTDGDEIIAGSSLINTDEDGDGLLNSAEGQVDTDGDGIQDYIDRDSDNDGIPDLIENGFSDVDRDGILDTLEEIEQANEKVLEAQPEKTESVIDEPPPPRVFRETRSTLLSEDSIEGPEFANTTSDVDTKTGADMDTNGNKDGTLTPVTIAPTPIEVALDSDNDGVPNYLDLDSDQDGISDLVESSSDFATNRLFRVVNTDTNQDGLDDSYNSDSAVHPVDTDTDGIPNYLDLDSDNDGVFDVVEAGSDDLDNDGMLDSVIDTNNNGIADLGIPLLGEALPDVDNDNIPDLIDVQIETGGRFGCTIAAASTSATLDPTLPAILLLLIFQLTRRKNQYTIRK